MTLEIPSMDVLQRVFAITPNEESMGSCFAYPMKGVFYLITAGHVLDGMKHGVKGQVSLFKDDKWVKNEATPYYVAGRTYREDDIDIAVVKTSIPADKNDTGIELSSASMYLGQDAYFLGFPYFWTKIKYKSEKMNSGFPIPFVKKATLSGFHEPLIYLDGHNNPGFSGGPVVFWDHEKKKRKILGIVSAYLNHEGEIKKVETSANEFYLENSGIGIAYNIKHAVNLLTKLEKEG